MLHVVAWSVTMEDKWWSKKPFPVSGVIIICKKHIVAHVKQSATTDCTRKMLCHHFYVWFIFPSTEEVFSLHDKTTFFFPLHVCMYVHVFILATRLLVLIEFLKKKINHHYNTTTIFCDDSQKYQNITGKKKKKRVCGGELSPSVVCLWRL